ncbi:MAG: porin family protein [Cellvibrio sp.]|uniref:porin family protein n=1 Tax=Cellvibrio sp. TaxID=1965322 RepID=UPI0031A5C553
MIRMIKWLSLLPIVLLSAKTIILTVSKNISSFKLPLLLAASVSFLASASFAADDPYAGGYLGARLGYSYNRHSCVDIAIECDRSDSGYGIFAGYDFENQLGIEVSATQLGDTSVVYPDVSLRGELFTADLSLKYNYQLSEKIKIFGRVGVAHWEGKIIGWDREAEDSGQRPTAGLGVHFPLSTQVDARIDYQYFDELGNSWMGYTDAHFFSFSFVWNFSKSKKYSSDLSASPPRVSLATPLAVKPVGSLSEGTIDHYVENILSAALDKQ